MLHIYLDFVDFNTEKIALRKAAEGDNVVFRFRRMDYLIGNTAYELFAG